MNRYSTWISFSSIFSINHYYGTWNLPVNKIVLLVNNWKCTWFECKCCSFVFVFRFEKALILFTYILLYVHNHKDENLFFFHYYWLDCNYGCSISCFYRHWYDVRALELGKCTCLPCALIPWICTVTMFTSTTTTTVTISSSQFLPKHRISNSCIFRCVFNKSCVGNFPSTFFPCALYICAPLYRANRERYRWIYGRVGWCCGSYIGLHFSWRYNVKSIGRCSKLSSIRKYLSK